MLRRHLWLSMGLLGLAALPCGLFLGGCGGGSGATGGGGGGGTGAMSGTIQVGQHSLSGATVQLYTVGGSGNGSAATPMLTQPVTTASNGNFLITGDYTCGQSSSGAAIAGTSNQVYLVATGGDPGLAPGTDNTSLVLMVALGPCSGLGSVGNIVMNEVTTVAAAWALAPFMTNATHVGASATNAAGITSAFANSQKLVSVTTGLQATLPAGQSVELGKLYALANSIASCVDSDGTGCGPLFAAATPAGGTAPADTLTAALNVVKHPGQNVGAVFAAKGTNPPYPSALTAAPNDWTMSLTVTGGGLNEPTQLGVDATGNVFVANYPGSLSGFSPQGVALTGSPWGAGTLSDSYGMTVDSTGNIWVTNEQAPGGFGSVTGFYGASSGHTLGGLIQTNNSAYSYDGSIVYPVALAADTSGNILIASFNGNSATEYNNGTLVNGYLGYGYSAEPTAISSDGTGGLWLADSGSSLVSHVGANGRIVSNPSCCSEADGIATDALGNAWVANYGSASISEVGPGCDATGVSANAFCTAATSVVKLNQVTGGGLSYPGNVSVDAAQNVWVVNVYSPGLQHGSFSEIAGNAGTVAAGTAISPASGYGLDVKLVQPFDIVPDASGNLWVSNYAQSNLVMFFGLATPTATPARPYPVAP
jgi:hypothetical protein